MRHEIAPEMKSLGVQTNLAYRVCAHTPTAMELDRAIEKLQSGGGKLEQTDINRMNGDRELHVDAHQLLDVHVGKRNDITTMLERVEGGEGDRYDETKLRQNADYFDKRIIDLQDDVRTTNARLMEDIRAKEHTF